MASLTNKSFTATQYALLTSLAAVPRIFIASSSGHIVDLLGWVNFFVFCSLAALPGLFLIYYLNKWHKPKASLKNT
jgi:PAT family beta-lactamase induction signal transducer AmpG